MKYNLIVGFIILMTMVACNADKNDYDASGNFEADEVIVSAQQNGQLLSFNIVEGNKIVEGAVVGQIDVAIPKLQKEHTEATIAALAQKTTTTTNQTEVVKKQIAVQQTQLDYLLQEKERTKNLIKADAAPRKQLDDITAQINQLQKEMAVSNEQILLNNNATDNINRSVLSERTPLKKIAEQYQTQIDKGKIVNPVYGVVLAQYAQKGEMALVGKPLYKIANIDTLTLRAYVTGTQLPQIKIGQTVKIGIDKINDSIKKYTGTISWIADKSEFTPKTIQTKDERANVVYAIKIRVGNDGYLKIGMYGEVLFYGTVHK